MEKTVKIQSDEGMHARPAGIFVKKASEFTSKIEVKVGDVAKNAKSIMSIMSLGLQKGSEMTIVATGDDAEQAVNALADLVNNNFAQA
jgi:phosphocarrier protein HPr